MKKVPSSRSRDNCDVAVLGSGFAGSILSIILARQGVDVVLIDSATHPRFAIGESTIPHTSLLLSLLAEKYDVPELEDIAFPDRLASRVAPTSGIKRSFGFAYHRFGERFDPEKAHQFGTGSKDESHLFRQDVDEYLFHSAIRRGARGWQQTQVNRVALQDDHVELETSKGSLKARYVVDATGYRSILASEYGLREQPTTLKHRSRSLFTHMTDVREFENGVSKMLLPWEQSTLHHVFPGGWIWVIPFGNTPNSTNQLTSVGLTLDPQVYPDSQAIPEDEFRSFLDRIPSAREQFVDARAVRPWVSTGRMQYSSSCSVGSRYCLLSHAAGFVDPLFSRGLINTVEGIGALLDPLLNSLRTDDFDVDAFQVVDEVNRRVLTYNDDLVRYAYQSWSDFEVWDAWLRVWALGTIITEFRLMSFIGNSTSEDSIIPTQSPVFSNFEDPSYRELFSAACRLMEQSKRGDLKPAEASAAILSAADKHAFPVLLSTEGMRRAGWLPEGRELTDFQLRIARDGYRWAITNPLSRDLFGTPETYLRWRAHLSDPHLV